MATDEYTTACLEKEAREYEKAIALFTKILSEQNNTTNKNYLIMVYKRRAECYYKLAKFQNVIDDINKAKQEGFDISKDPDFFYILNHCTIQCTLQQVINNFEDQARLDPRRGDYYRVIRSLDALKLSNIFTYREEHPPERDRSQSRDRHKKR
ncbi:unnamed protein product [Rotaria sp. Silwood2]|nr:unnamed protein product [Rotaria sp. Silwood2]CAF4623281.1 unnamed protein product [Rotaria sp. Silwood2]